MWNVVAGSMKWKFLESRNQPCVSSGVMDGSALGSSPAVIRYGTLNLTYMNS